MTVISLTSAKGAPGVTTSAVALALVWPRPVLLVEADVAGGSSILAGYFQGNQRHDRGLIDLAAAHRQGRLSEGLHEASLAFPNSNARFIPGLATPTQAGTMERLWEPIAAVLRGLESTGTDVIVDAGRLGAAGAPTPLIREADVTLLVTRTNLPAVAATRARAAVLRQELEARGTGEDALWMLLVGEGQPFSKREVKSAVNLPEAATIAWDPVNAEVVSLGKTPANPKKWEASTFVRSARAAASEIDSIVRGRRERLSPGALLSQLRGGGSDV